MSYTNLFTPGNIGSMALKNRIFMAAMDTGYAEANGDVSDTFIRFYEERAKGGAGLIITEYTRVDDDTGAGAAIQLSLTSDDRIPSFQKLAKAVQKHGCKLVVQLHHAGLQGSVKNQKSKELVSPSGGDTLFGETSREITREEITTLIRKFADAALRAKQAGADGVELHAAHGYLLGEFLSPLHNRREDEFGGSIENRVRILKLIIAAVRDRCGADYPILVRINGTDSQEGGLDLQEAVEVSRLLEQYGADGIDVSNATHASWPPTIEPISFPQGWKKHLAKTIKAAVSIPVLAVNVVRKPDFAETLLEEGVSDFVGLGRGLLADPKWAEKAATGKAEEIRACVSCLYCVECIVAHQPLRCALNARTGRELEFPQLEITGDKRKVVVVGGGPGGMEAARVAAKRGFEVTLFEQKPMLGGSVYPGSKPPLKEKLEWMMDHMEQELVREGVTIHKETSATVEQIESLAPYAVMIAAGSSPMIPNIPGVAEHGVLSVMDILEETVSLRNKKVVVVGSGMTGLETAEFLAAQGNEVEVIEMADTISPGTFIWNLQDVLIRLKQEQIGLHPSTRLLEIREDEILVEDMKSSGRRTIKADAVVLSLGVKSNQALIEPLKATIPVVEVIGDAIQPGRIGNAVHTGYEKAYVL